MNGKPRSVFEAAPYFCQKGYELDAGEWSDSNRRDIEKLREFYPELSHWGDLPLGVAFGDFSQFVLEVGWAHWMLDARDEIFLNYCCWRQTRGKWNLGLYEDLLSTADEWV